MKNVTILIYPVEVVKKIFNPMSNNVNTIAAMVIHLADVDLLLFCSIIAYISNATIPAPMIGSRTRDDISEPIFYLLFALKI